MVLAVVKGLLVPGTLQFFLIAIIPGTILLYRRQDGGRAGKLWITALVLFYLALSIPMTASALIGALSPSYPPVQTVEQARGATAVVVLGAGMHTYRSRGDVYAGATREHALRMMEAARVYRALDRPWVFVSGSLGNERVGEAHYMAVELKNLGVDPERIVEEAHATNTRDHALMIPPMLEARGVKAFVLVTSQQHIARALKAFRKVGLNPVPSTPEPYETRRRIDLFLPSTSALEASSGMLYDELATAYYWWRGWI